MTCLLVLLLDSLPVAYGQALLEQLHTYDLLALEVSAEPVPDGLAVDCRLTARIRKAGPLRFFLASEVRGLTAESEGRPVRAGLGAGGFEGLLRLFAGEVRGVPSLLTLAPDPPLEAGSTAVLRLRYVWEPPAGGWAYAGPEGLQTHLSSFWLPSMAGERFEARVDLLTHLEAEGPGTGLRTPRGWSFAAREPVQVVSLVAGKLERHSEGRLAVLVPPALAGRAPKLIRDLAAVVDTLEKWFGGGEEPFTLVVEPRANMAPSYCADGFVVIERDALELRREAWLALLAHECAHRWWGHRVGSPLVGRGGTFLREGLAQWSGLRVAGELLGAEAERALWRGQVRGYLRRIDLRRRGPVHFANEPSLRDATYLDEPHVPYLRGALVLRLLEHRLGPAAFRDGLRRFAELHRGGFAGLDDLAAALGEEELLRYYAETTRLPDLALDDVHAGESGLRATVACADPAWPGGRVPLRVTTDRGVHDVLVGPGAVSWRGEGRVLSLELDPERIHLDPLRANHVWPR